MKLYYRDFVTGKRRFTRAIPVKAIQGNIIKSWGLVVQSKSFSMFIPGYLLEAEGREILAKLRRRGDEDTIKT